MTPTKSKDWLEWPGGECPVPPLTLVSVLFSTGKESSGSASARAYRWDRMNLGGDIVAYRVESK